MNSIPISIVMSCYNEEEFVGRAIESILNQTFTKFEFIIVDDGSVDHTREIINRYPESDSRIKVVKNDKNIGLSASLNKAINIAKGKYIARMDADDEAFPDRLEKQYSFLLEREDVDILGSAIALRSKNGLLKGIRKCPEQSSEIRKRIFRKPLVFHPTILVKRSVYFKYGMYDSSIKWAEDADLWYRIFDQVTFHNLQIPLLYYTVKDSFSFNTAKQNFSIKYKNLKRRGLRLKYFPQLLYDSIVLGGRIIKYRI